jgi:hypothetical protein
VVGGAHALPGNDSLGRTPTRPRVRGLPKIRRRSPTEYSPAGLDTKASRESRPTHKARRCP